MTYSELFLDGNRGIYIPQQFAEAIDPADWTGIDTEDLDVLRAGPDHESYWDAWQDVLDHAETKDGRVLWQDGDLWLVALDKAIEDLNAYFSDVLEYETRHGDAGDAYSYLVEDADAEDVKRQLAEESMVKAEDGTGDSLGYKWIKKLDLDLRGLDVEDVIRLALEVFQMVPGSIWGPYENGLVLASFAVQEIETEIPAQFDGIVLDLIGDNGTDAYIAGTGRAYMTTDAVWFAVASVQDLQDAIDAEVKAEA
jgi:hypothetical protein